MSAQNGSTTDAPAPPAERAAWNTAPGAAPYTPRVLSIYDIWVHGISNTFAWRCPASTLQALYQKHASARHLDVGVGTGLFLARTRFPPKSRISLLDLNPTSLRHASERIRQHEPLCHAGDALSPATLEGLSEAPFDSIALMYLLHCLPGTLASKSVVFSHFGRLLSERGVLFGATILGDSAAHNLMGRCIMRVYHRHGVFSNRWDTLEDLKRGLEAHFRHSSVRVHGRVALFEASQFVPGPAPHSG
jgi:SAM-dependent methyltransferase